jgi:pimeloyl-ACP methyl ester carboxylesterase
MACGAKTSRSAADHPGLMTSEVEIQSADGLAIHGTLSRPPGEAAVPVVVLAHQMCSDRDEWSAPAHDWVAAFGARGIATLAIDLRGHGHSKVWPDGSTHDLCKEIEDPAAAGLYAAMVDDVKAAVGYARTAAKAPRVAIMGGSIGANSALVAFADDPEVAIVVALSPSPTIPRWRSWWRCRRARTTARSHRARSSPRSAIGRCCCSPPRTTRAARPPCAPSSRPMRS